MIRPRWLRKSWRLRGQRTGKMATLGPMWIKICGMTSADAIAAAVEAEVDAIGFVFAPSPRQVTPGQAAQLAALAPRGIGEVADGGRAAELARQTEVILAGGLSAQNVAEAIQAVRPFGVDVSSGVEDVPGVKDPAKIHEFVRAVRAAAARPEHDT